MKITSEEIVGEHSIAGHRIHVQRTTWRGTSGLSYDLVDAGTGNVLTTGESFDGYPTQAEMEEAISALDLEAEPIQLTGRCAAGTEGAP